MIVEKQVLILLIFISIGYFLRKANIIPHSGSGVLSKMLFYIFSPALTFNTFATKFTIPIFKENYMILIYGTLILIALILISKLFSKLFTKDKYERGIYEYTLITPNYGFAGYALMQALYGDEMLLQMMIFVIPLTIYVFTEGYRKLMNFEHVSLMKIINPSIISVVIGTIFGFSEIQLPDVCMEIITKSADCMSPISMIMIGFVVAEFNLKEVLMEKKAYIVAFIRLVVIPVLLCSTLKLLNAPENIVLLALMTYAMPAGANTIVFPKLIDRDCRLGASFAVISSVFLILTMSVLTKLFT